MDKLKARLARNGSNIFSKDLKYTLNWFTEKNIKTQKNNPQSLLCGGNSATWNIYWHLSNLNGLFGHFNAAFGRFNAAFWAASAALFWGVKFWIGALNSG